MWKVLLSTMLLVFALCGVNAAAANKVVNMTYQNGMNLYVGQNESTANTVYHKFTVPASGALVVTGNTVYSWGRSSISVTLCNRKYQSIDSSSSGAYVNAQNESAQVYAVKKGTYYLKVSGRSNYIIGAQFTKWTDKGGASKSKAKTIKVNKTYKGMMPAGESYKKADWYKFKVTKSKKMKLTVGVEGNGYFEFRLYGPGLSKSGAYFGSVKNSARSSWLVNARNNKKVKASRGTYYLKVTRSSSSKKASGIYNVKFTLK